MELTLLGRITGNVIDSNITNVANSGTGNGSNKSLRVTDTDHVFTAGTYAGFHIGTVFGLSNVLIKLYKNGTLVETSSAFSSGIGTADFIFKSTVDFNAIEIFVPSGGIDVYYPILNRTCPTILECNTLTEWKNNTFSDLTVVKTVVGLGNVINEGNLIDSDDTNYSQIQSSVTGLNTIEVKDGTNTYGAGTFVGFNLSVSATIFSANTFTITTYNNGVATGDTKTFTVGGNGFPTGARVDTGLLATKNFNSVKIAFDTNLDAQVYYPILIRSCASPDLVCNIKTDINQNGYSVVVNPENTGAGGLNFGSSWSPNFGAVVSPSTTDYTILSASGIAASAYVSVKDISKVYPAGTFAGFKIQNISVFSASFLSGLTINTYNGGVLQESQSGASIFASVSAFDITDPQTIGFETTKTFDEVQIVVNNPLGVNLGETRIFNMVLKKACEGTVSLICNTPTNYTTPNYPVNISLPRTGLTGVLATGNYVSNPENVIDADTNNYANITLLSGLGNSGSISVKKSLSPLPAGYFAGFTIRNTSLINSSLLGGITITTYLNGVEQESVSGTSVIFGSGSTIFDGSTKQTLGIVTKFDFDEVRISVNNVVGYNLGTTEVYNLVITKTCQGIIDCNNEYYLVNPVFPVVLDVAYTGTSGLSCSGASVSNPGNVIDSDPANYAVFVLSGTGCTTSIGVVDPSNTYPKGTFTGYTVKNTTSLANINFFQNTTIKTYLDGVLQESKTASALSNFSLFFIPIWGVGSQNIGFYTTKPFDEVVIEVSAVFGTNTVYVYGLFIDTKTSDGGSLSCASGACYKPGAIATVGSPALISKVGISSLSRIGTQNSDNWPAVRNGAWLALEARTKGFVVNRMAFNSSGNPVGIPAADFVEGMFVYDTTNKCLKMYTSQDGGNIFGWFCIRTQTCPD